MKPWKWYYLKKNSEWNLRPYPAGRSAATVFGNGVWHTWDHLGTGGENSSEETIPAAMKAAELSALRQGFLSSNAKAEPTNPL